MRRKRGLFFKASCHNGESSYWVSSLFFPFEIARKLFTNLLWNWRHRNWCWDSKRRGLLMCRRRFVQHHHHCILLHHCLCWACYILQLYLYHCILTIVRIVQSYPSVQPSCWSARCVLQGGGKSWRFPLGKRALVPGVSLQCRNVFTWICTSDFRKADWDLERR